MGGGLPLFTRFAAAIRSPEVVVVSGQEASSMAASGATAPDHSASRAASPSSTLVPGSLQLLVPWAGAGWIWANVPPYCDSPNAVRNSVQSAARISVSSSTAIVWPPPRIGWLAFHSGDTL